MNKELKDILLAILHNNEILLGQTEDFDKRNGGKSARAISNMYKIYDGLNEKLAKDAPLTSADCGFMIIAINLTKASLQKQQQTIKATLAIYETIHDLMQEAAGAEDESVVEECLSREIDYKTLLEQLNT